MFHLPDLRFLFYLAMFGLGSAVLLIIGGGGWFGYHLYHAMAMYLGAA